MSVASLHKPLLEHHEHNDSVYFTGNLNAAIGVISEDGISMTSEVTDEGKHVVKFTFGKVTDALVKDDVFDVWGAGDTLEEAFRYALGAEFGPIDENYDEAALRAELERYEP